MHGKHACIMATIRTCDSSHCLPFPMDCLPFHASFCRRLPSSTPAHAPSHCMSTPYTASHVRTSVPSVFTMHARGLRVVPQLHSSRVGASFGCRPVSKGDSNRVRLDVGFGFEPETVPFRGWVRPWVSSTSISIATRRARTTRAPSTCSSAALTTFLRWQKKRRRR